MSALSRLLGVLLFFSAIAANGQTVIYTWDFALGGKVYESKALKLVDGTCKVKVALKPAAQESDWVEFTTDLKDLEVFKIIFSTTFNAKFSETPADVINTGANLFLRIAGALASLNTTNKPPVVGTVRVYEKGEIYIEHTTTSTTLDATVRTNGDPDRWGSHVAKVTIDKVQIEFQNGFIENIKVIAHHNSALPLGKYNAKSTDRLIFENTYPIGFSSKADFRNLGTIWLYERNWDLGWLCLTDVLEFEQNHTLNTRDFSPKNEVVLLKGGEEKELDKDESSRLLEMQVYTDFIGIDQAKPNGLIQTEIDRDVNINTKRRSYKSSWVNYGLFNYAKFTFNLSKIEENNRRVGVSHKLSPDGSVINYIETLDVKNHEVFNLGVNINPILLDLPRFKTTLFGDVGFRYGLATLGDTLGVFEGSTYVPNGQFKRDVINTGNLFYQFRLEISPESRYGFMISWRRNNYRSYSNYFNMIDEEASYLDTDPAAGKAGNNRFDTWRATAWLKRENGKVFLRYTFNNIVGKPNANFSQLQLGYSYYMFASKESDKLGN